jgi:hypothetical protein
MSAVSRALEVPRRWAESESIRSSPVSGRWGLPLWPADEPINQVGNPVPPVIPVAILALALLHAERS